jgi:hypothetical protein
VNFTLQGRSVTKILDESYFLEIDNKILRDRVRELEDELEKLGVPPIKVQ